MSHKTTEALLSREYPITLYKAEEGGFVAEHRDLPGCLTQGETLDEAVEKLASARRLWITTAAENGDEVPLPSTDEQYGGRVLVRMPKSLHRRLVEEAGREEVSLNQLLVGLLSENLATRTAVAALGRIETSIQALADRTAEIVDTTSRLTYGHERAAWPAIPEQVEAIFEVVAQLATMIPGKEAGPWSRSLQTPTRRRGHVKVQLSGLWFPVDVLLASAEVELEPWRKDRPRPKHDLSDTISFNVDADPPHALRGYRLRFFDPESKHHRQVGMISVVYRLQLVPGERAAERVAQGGATPSQEALFDLFAWPYWRQFAIGALTDAGWARLGLPLVRPGIGKEGTATARARARGSKGAKSAG